MAMMEIGCCREWRETCFRADLSLCTFEAAEAASSVASDLDGVLSMRPRIHETGFHHGTAAEAGSAEDARGTVYGFRIGLQASSDRSIWRRAREDG